MANLFLKVNKYYYFLDLSPLGILILSQIEEYVSKGRPCFISNEQLAKQFGSSLSSVKREIADLEKKQYIKRDTKSTQQGKERLLTINYTGIKDALSRKVQSGPCEAEVESAEFNLTLPDGSMCTLPKVQGEPIKDKNPASPGPKDKNKGDKTATSSTLVEPSGKPKDKPKWTPPAKAKVIKMPRAALEEHPGQYNFIQNSDRYCLDTLNQNGIIYEIED